ncbi:uncharacterized protein LOC110242020 isoform X2 [Exaiptasia diaphana]|uniref:Uncharacterized protein n=1 Tax=Exaiptasia diaphana TaxID=2652724 RepID=A0A913XFE9_EXADI|nr:uncharacterized protein LOC110242020 isoform X2 [Exaiptasia diaphana]
MEQFGYEHESAENAETLYGRPQTAHSNKQGQRELVCQANASVLEISTVKKLESLPTEQHSLSTDTEMVFPHTRFPSSYEKSSLHISAIEGKNSLSLLKDCKPGMKRPSQSDACLGPSTEKRKRFNVTPFFMKEEISEADFQMTLIKQSLALKKDWVYQQVLEKLGVKPPSGHSVLRSGGIVSKTKAERNMHMSQLNSSILVRSKDGNKVHDEEGNCYIDEDDYNSFYRPKERNNGQYKAEMASSDASDCQFTSKRHLNFTFHGSNGGVAIDHQTLPKVVGIHSVPRKCHPEKERSQPKNIAATLVGSSYKTIGKLSPVEKCPVKDEKWWPPSPESIPDELSREGEGLLKVMTPDDLKAYGLPKQENSIKEPSESDDDVFVTQVLKRGVDNVSPSVPKADIHNMPPLQLDANGKPSNYKEILLYYITQQVKNNPQNPSLKKITNKAIAGRQKTMNMDELCKKLINTREKLENEQMKWKRKLLSSLEVVLIKKIRKLEQETEEKVPEGINLEGPAKSEQSSGSQSDIVAVMEDLTNDVSVPRARKISETTTTRRSVSVIRGYESS